MNQVTLTFATNLNRAVCENGRMVSKRFYFLPGDVCIDTSFSCTYNSNADINFNLRLQWEAQQRRIFEICNKVSRAHRWYLTPYDFFRILHGNSAAITIPAQKIVVLEFPPCPLIRFVAFETRRDYRIVLNLWKIVFHVQGIVVQNKQKFNTFLLRYWLTKIFEAPRKFFNHDCLSFFVLKDEEVFRPIPDSWQRIPTFVRVASFIELKTSRFFLHPVLSTSSSIEVNPSPVSTSIPIWYTTSSELKWRCSKMSSGGCSKRVTF